jgi:hypothetical protein
VVDNNIDIPSNQDYCGQHLLTVTKWPAIAWENKMVLKMTYC